MNNIDKKGQKFVEFPITEGSVRLTYIKKGWDNDPSIRIQIKDEKGHLRQGPEIPIKFFGNIFSSTLELITKVDK